MLCGSRSESELLKLSSVLLSIDNDHVSIVIYIVIDYSVVKCRQEQRNVVPLSRGQFLWDVSFFDELVHGVGRAALS